MSRWACVSLKIYAGIQASKDPVAIMKKIILSPYIYMHGPEHHVLVGSALRHLLRAWRTGFGRGPGRNEEQRGTGAGRYLRFVGNPYGAAVSTGIFVSLITGASPLSGKEWGLCNE